MSERLCAECGAPMADKAPSALYCSDTCTARAGRKRREARFREALTKADKLAIAGAVAPMLRRKTPRRVTVVGKDGKPVREITDVDLALSVLKRVDIEFSVDQRAKADLVTCEICRGIIRVETPGATPKRCVLCRNGRCHDCGAPLLSPHTERRARMQGNPARCRACACKSRKKPSKYAECYECNVRLPATSKPRERPTLCRICTNKRCAAGGAKSLGKPKPKKGYVRPKVCACGNRLGKHNRSGRCAACWVPRCA